jgi:5S rRNA maturation endonuclease (ribonuclease M5)/DNA-binding transcriptional ArsR family regulator
MKYSTNLVGCQSPLDVVLSRLEGVRRAGNGFSALCPAHDDTHQSLSVSEGRDGRVLLKCHAGCDIKTIVQALGLELRDLFPPKPERKPKPERTSERKIVATYSYVDESGKVLFEVVRYEPKAFAQRRPDGNGDWIWNLESVRRVLYKLPDVLRAVQSGETIFIVEGEKDADALGGLGLVATTNPHGAGKWRDDYSQTIKGAHVVILPDKDDAGRKHADQVARSLWGKASSIKVVELPGDGIKDVSDWLTAGGTKEQLLELILQAPEWKPAPAMAYDELRAAFEKWLALPDDLAIRFVLSVVIANRLSGDPLWAFIVGPSGSSKTEFVNPLTTLEFVRPLDQLTTNTFLSGKQKKDANASLLLQLPYGAILLIRDFSSILDMHREKRDEIFSQLRKIYDGHLARATGEGGESAYLSWTGKVGVLACCTPAIERYRSLSTTLGERFIYFYMQTADRLTIARTARVNRPALREMREELAQAVKRFFDGLSIPESVEMPDDIGDWIARVADFVAVARTGVERDSYSASKEILESPDPEIPSRLAQQLDVLTCAHAVLMGRNRVEPGDVELTRHVALASIPTTRRRIISLFAREGWRELTTAEVANALDLPTNTIRRHLEDLTALGLLKRREGDTNAYVWWVADFCRDGWELLTGGDTRGATGNASPDLYKDVAPQKSGYACVGVYPQKGESLCLGGDFCGATPKEPLGCDNPVAPQVSEPPLDDEDCPF